MTAYRRPPVRAEQPQAAREQVDMHPRVLPWLGEGGSEEIVPRGRDVARAGEQEQRQTQSRRGHRLPSAERRLTAGACTPSASSALLSAGAPSASSALLSIAAPPRPTHSADSSPLLACFCLCAEPRHADAHSRVRRAVDEWWVLSSLCAVRSESVQCLPVSIIGGGAQSDQPSKRPSLSLLLPFPPPRFLVCTHVV